MDKQEIQTLIDSLGIEYSAKFVPFSQSRNKNEKQKSLNWLVTISKGNQLITTDYMQGIGHLPDFDFQNRSMLYHEYINNAVENQTWVKNYLKANLTTTFKLTPPQLIDVLYSLIQDSDVINYSSFEDWADCTGYEKDSRQAEKIYQACLATALKLRGMFGDSTLAQLNEAYQDY